MIFLKTKIIQGRGFFENSLADSNAIVINESYRKQLGWENPIGKKIFIPGQTIEESTPLKIVGVVNDFHFASLHQEVKPLIIMNAPEQTRFLSLKINSTNQAEVIALVDNKWEELFPGFPFEYFMQQSKYEEMYTNEVNMGRLFIYFSILALFIAALGLLGLSSYLAEQRTKEIGIRKVLGSSVKQIIVLVTKDFSKWVLIAVIIAIPLTYIVMEYWLGNFAFHTHISWTIFLISGIIAFLIAYLTILSQALRASKNNPLEALKYE
ncbi:MAG: FtsX-like permease family protein [Bacteroidales bacterium]